MATLAEAQSNLAAWEAASLALASSSSYTLPGGRSITRANADEVTRMIAFWQRQVARLGTVAAGGRTGGHKLARFTPT